MNYRNKTIFDWKNFQSNEISSLISLQFMKVIKNKLHKLLIHNVIIRDINNQIGIIFQIDRFEFNKEEGTIVYNLINEIISQLNYKLKLFGIQYLSDNKFKKDKNIIFLFFFIKILYFIKKNLSNSMLIILIIKEYVYYQIVFIKLIYRYYNNFI